MSPIQVSVVIGNYNGAAVILNCLQSLFTHLPRVETEIIVVDNRSTDGSAAAIAQQFPTVRLIQQNHNAGFGAANNVGVRHAQGTYLLLLNSDTLLDSKPIPVLQAKLEQSPQVGIVGPQLFNVDGSFQLSVAHAIGLWGELRTLWQVRQYRVPAHRPALAQRYTQDRYVDIVVGAAMFMRRSLYEAVGGFDETFFMYFEESDLCQRVRDLGYRVLYTPAATVTHLGGYSVAQAAGKMAAEYRRSQRYYYQKHRPPWEQWLLHRYLAWKQWRQARRHQ